MFKRRDRLHPFKKAKEFVWPSIGWRRSFLYLKHRIGRLPGTSRSIAAGFASGAAVSFTPFMGLHILLCLLMAKLLRGSYLAALLGTLVGNPWTFPVIWIASYKLGSLIMGVPHNEAALKNLSLTVLFEHPMKLLAPMSIGGVLMAIVAWFISFYFIRLLVRQYKVRRKRSRLAKRIRLIIREKKRRQA